MPTHRAVMTLSTSSRARRARRAGTEERSWEAPRGRCADSRAARHPPAADGPPRGTRDAPGAGCLPLALRATSAPARLAVVDITTGRGDNAHRIFQSLNATGVNLTQADLLRNLIFMLLPGRAAAVYDEVWRPMEQLVGFGNLEGLARVDLQRRGIDVAVDDVFRRHQDRLEGMPGGEAVAETGRGL